MGFTAHQHKKAVSPLSHAREGKKKPVLQPNKDGRSQHKLTE